MDVEYLDPRAEPGVPVVPYGLSLPADAGPVTIGLLANGFPDSAVFLDALAEELNRLDPMWKFLRYAKPNASVPAGDQLLDGIAAECRAVVTAYGH